MHLFPSACETAPALMESLPGRHRVPGGTLALILQGKLIHSCAFGVRNEQNSPMTEGVLFECASLTKSLFALLAMQEADAGRLDLDAPIAPLLQDDPWSEDPRFFAITPRMCLCHACGLPNWQKKPMDILFDPGTSFSYSGEGYFLLQRLIEQNLGQDMNALFRQRFFIPFGMESSTAYWTPAVSAAFSTGYARDGSVRKVRDSRRTSGNAPEPNAAWSLYSYAADYARFLCALMNGQSGLSEASFQEMTTPQNQADAHIHWGLGFGIPDQCPEVMWHWGDNSGFQSFAVWDKITHDGVVITTNSDNGMDLYLDALSALTDLPCLADISSFIRSAE